jgi:hypothetical protein
MGRLQVTVTHRQTGTPTYISWKNMKARCSNPQNPKYADYGGRGITVCPEWQSYEQFFADMGECPSGETLERRENTKGYSKDNCVWAGRSQQNLNKRIPVNNQSGIKGVHWSATKFKWVVKLPNGGRNTSAALQTKDFFEACCVRKAWEAR